MGLIFISKIYVQRSSLDQVRRLSGTYKNKIPFSLKKYKFILKDSFWCRIGYFRTYKSSLAHDLHLAYDQVTGHKCINYLPMDRDGRNDWVGN